MPDDLKETSLGLRMDPGTDYESWAAFGQDLAATAKTLPWALGDWVFYGWQFGARYREALDATGLDYQTLRNYAWVAGRWEMSRRRDTLSFSHHEELANLALDEEQDEWLDRAEESGWTVKQLRVVMREARTPTLLTGALAAEDEDEEPEPEPDPNAGLLSALESLRLCVTLEDVRRWRPSADAAGYELATWFRLRLDGLQ